MFVFGVGIKGAVAVFGGVGRAFRDGGERR